MFIRLQAVNYKLIKKALHKSTYFIVDEMSDPSVTLNYKKYFFWAAFLQPGCSAKEQFDDPHQQN